MALPTKISGLNRTGPDRYADRRGLSGPPAAAPISLFKAALFVRDGLAGSSVLLANHALVTNDCALGDVDFPRHRAFIEPRFPTGKGAFLPSLTSRSGEINTKRSGFFVEGEMEDLRGSFLSWQTHS